MSKTMQLKARINHLAKEKHIFTRIILKYCIFNKYSINKPLLKMIK